MSCLINYFQMGAEGRLEYWMAYVEGLHEYLRDWAKVAQLTPAQLWGFEKEIERGELMMSMLAKEVGETVEERDVNSAVSINYNSIEL